MKQMNMTMINELKEKYNKLIESDLTNLKKGLADKLINGMFQEIFDKDENIKSIGWSQYTAWFNDGEECEFGAPHNVFINDIDEWDDDKDENVDYDEIYNLVEDTVGVIDGDLLRFSFGDHIKVTINRDGSYETEEWEHD